MPGPVLDGSGKFLTTGQLVGTPLDWFDLSMALTPGMSEATYLAQIKKALAYWVAVQAAPSQDGDVMLKANFAVSALNAELTRVSTPPPNNIHTTYPV